MSIRRRSLICILLPLLGAPALFAQAVVEDFHCQIPASASPGKVTSVTCPESNGFENMAATAVLTVGTPQPGDNVIINGQTYRFVTDLTACQPNDVKIASVADYGTGSWVALNNAYHLAAAINGTGEGWVYNGTTWLKRTLAGTEYCSSTQPNQDVEAYGNFLFSRADLYFIAKTGGVDGEFAVAASGSPVWYQRDRVTRTNSLRRQWMVKVIGATGDWAGISSAARLATYTGPNTFDISYDSSKASSFAGQQWVIRRAAYDGSFFFFHNSSDIPGPVEIARNDELGVYVERCGPEDSDAQCGKAFMSPDNQKDYGNKASITQMTVAGGIATVTVGPWLGAAYGYQPPGPGVRFYLRGFDHYFFARPIAKIEHNDQGQARLTIAGHGCSPGDQAVISGPGGPAASLGLFNISIVDGNTIDLPYVADPLTFGYLQGAATITCNPEGRPAQAEAGYFVDTRKGGLKPSKAPVMLTYSGSTFTFATNLADGVYSGPGLQARIEWQEYPYMYLFPRTTPSGNAWYGPIDQLPFHLKSGTFQPGMNRIRYWVNWGANAQRRSDGGYTTNLGTYATTSLEPLSARAHFYHYTGSNAYRGRWMQFEFNAAPSHEVGAAGGILWPNNPTAGHPYYPAWAGGSTDWPYWRGNNILYFDSNLLGGFESSLGLGGSTTSFGPVELDSAANEPEEWVRSRTSVYSPQRYINGTLQNDGGYEIGWSGIPFGPDFKYQVRYSTTQSIRTLGWSNADSGGTQTAPAQDLGNANWLWQSPTMDEQPNFWAAIRPVMPIVAASDASQPVWLIFRADPGMLPGDKVAVSGAGGGRDQYDVPVLQVAPRRIWFADQPATEENPAWQTGGGKLISIAASGGSCLASFTEPHGLVPGWMIEITGSTSAVLGSTPVGYPSAKRYTVSTVSDDHSFTFSCRGVPDGTYATSAAGLHMNIFAFPGVELAGSAAGGWSGGGTMVSTEEYKNFAEVYLPQFELEGVPPLPPCSLRAAAQANGIIRLDWEDCSSNETRFIVERRSGSNAPFVQVGSVTANTSTFIDHGLQDGISYSYRVVSSNDHGQSQPTAEVTAMALAVLAPPDAPQLLQAGGATASQVILTWQDRSSNEAGFSIEISAADPLRSGASSNLASFAELVRVPANTTSYTVQGLQPQTSYAFRVRAFNDYGSSTYAGPAAVMTTPATGISRPAPVRTVGN